MRTHSPRPLQRLTRQQQMRMRHLLRTRQRPPHRPPPAMMPTQLLRQHRQRRLLNHILKKMRTLWLQRPRRRASA